MTELSRGELGAALHPRWMFHQRDIDCRTGEMTMAFCEIARFDKQGRIVSGSCYYDQYTLLAQLGHVQPLPAAA
jgi:hypothetical protein